MRCASASSAEGHATKAGWLARALGALAGSGRKRGPEGADAFARAQRQPTPGCCTDSAIDSGADSALTRRVRAPDRRSEHPLQNLPPAVHAVRLLQWLREPGGRLGEILASELREIHVEMCLELGWRARPWNPIARELAKRLSDGRKTWVWLTDSKGHRWRRRVYRIDSGADSEPRPTGPILSTTNTRPPRSLESNGGPNERRAA